MADWGPEALDAELSAYLDGELSPAEVADIERRLRASPEVRARLEALRSVSEHLRVLPRHAAPPGVAEAVRESVAHSAADVASELAVAAAPVAALGALPAEVRPRSGQPPRSLRMVVRLLASAALVGFGMVVGRFVLTPPPAIAPATVSTPGLVPPPPPPRMASRSMEANGDGLPPQQAESVGKFVAAAREPASLGQRPQAAQPNDGATEPPAEALRAMTVGIAAEKERSIVATLARRLGEAATPAPETARVQIVFAPRSQAEFEAARDALQAWTGGVPGAPDDAELRMGLIMRAAAAAEAQAALGGAAAIDATLAVNPIEVGQIVAGIETAAAGPQFENWMSTDIDQHGGDELAAARGERKSDGADRDAAAPSAGDAPPAQPAPPGARSAPDAPRGRETRSANPRAPRVEAARGKADAAPASVPAPVDSAGRIAGGGRSALDDRETGVSQPTPPPPGVGGFTAGQPPGARAGADYKQAVPGAAEPPPGLVWMRIVILPPPAPASAPTTQPHAP